MHQRPSQFRINLKIKVPVCCDRGNLVELKIIKSQQPIRLIEPVFALQRRPDQGQFRRAVGDRRESRIIHPLQFIAGIEPRGLAQNGRIIRPIRTDDHLRRLPRGREPWRALAGMGFVFRHLLAQPEIGHRLADLVRLLLGCVLLNGGIGGQLDIDRQSVRQQPRFGN